ncbi:MAG: Rne/Rng family ribonuclease [Caulobacterales bacterium]|uniref:Rne/Rng family ribonuclease n=1 Tax=Glycocaulis sp. TaxID=1969725 RepID=UPI003FA12831
MSRKMLIDASHPEETRVVIVESNRVEDFDFESASRRPIRGNIYLAQVTRVEPSLQAAFVEYGGNKHGFLAFNEIHPDYYQIPFEDRQALREAEAELARENEAEAGDENDDDEDLMEEIARKRRNLLRKYKIQEVIKRRQVMLVQVSKEERGNKGAALTTYLSLAGRYCVLMPNTDRGGGISRKITSATDRKRLKSAVQALDLPRGMGLIIRTAGAARTKLEIKRDYDYLIRLWETIRETTLKSVAPSLIYEEGNLVKRAIRDLYDKDIEHVLVEGEEAYKEAKSFMRMLMPSHATKVQPYTDDMPLFLRHGTESQLEAIYSPVAQLKSGGYLVINPTEALVAIDVNSGKSTRERNIEQTALRTNLEAAEEAARQMRLRDLAGLVIIDFIDMEDSKNVRAVEKKMKEVLAKDRARIQTSKISQFGLMEISRQRRRTSLVEGSTEPCPHCNGIGYLRSVESSALAAVRSVEEEGLKGRASKIALHLPNEVALYLLNEKREYLRAVEQRFDMRVIIATDLDLKRDGARIERLEARKDGDRGPYVPKPLTVESAALTPEDEADLRAAREESALEEAEAAEGDSDESTGGESNRGDGQDKRGRRRRRRGRGRGDGEGRSNEAAGSDGASSDESGDEADSSGERAEPARADDSEDEGSRKRRRRGRRGGRGRRRRGDGEARENQGDTAQQAGSGSSDDAADIPGLAVIEPQESDALGSGDTPPARERPVRRRKKAEPAESGEAAAPAPAEEGQDAAAIVAEEAPAKPKRTRRKKADAAAEEAPAAEAVAEAAEKPKRTRKAPARKAAVKAAPEAAETAEAAEAVSEPEKPARKPRARKAAAKADAPQEVPEAETPATDANDGGNDGGSGPKRAGWWQRSGKLFGLGS